MKVTPFINYINTSNLSAAKNVFLMCLEEIY